MRSIALLLLLLFDCSAAEPNVLLLMADQFRGDALDHAHTPNLDRLAAEGCRFERAYTSTPSCTPARAALLTGMSPWGHGMLGYFRVAVRYPVELPRIFTAAGYRTHAIGKNHFFPQRNRHGYQSIELDESGRVESKDFVSDYRQWFRKVAPKKNPDATGIGWNDYRARPYALPEELHPTRWTADRAIAFLKAHDRSKPFLLKVSFARPHSPYDPPRRFLEMYEAKSIPKPAIGAWADATQVDREGYTRARNNLGPAITLGSRHAYLANVTFIDEQIGRVLAALGDPSNTIIVFLSDHGDMLGDHHLWRKTYAYEGSARIPLIVRWRGKRGQVRYEPVEIRDVLPTLLDACGLPIPEQVEGLSLLKLMRGEKGWRETLDLEHATTYWPGNVWTALTDGRFKYIYFAFDGREQLFDLQTDPGETRSLTDPALLAKWRARMVAHLAPRGAPWVVDGKLGIRKKRIVVGRNYPR